jgi:hypothetical protein
MYNIVELFFSKLFFLFIFVKNFKADFLNL